MTWRYIFCIYGVLAAYARAQSSTPPPITISQTEHRQSAIQVVSGDIFVTPSPPKQLAVGEVASIGPEILDGQGRPIWFLPLPAGQLTADFRVQSYHGNPVLTWAQGPGFQITKPGSNTDYICDTRYKVIATVQAGNGLNADEHEFQLTPEGTALVTIYNNVPTDLSSIGGPVNGIVQEGVAQEVDVATGKVLLEWHSLDHVALSESYVSAPASGNYDYFHINAVNLDTDGNLLISSRHTWTIYKVDRHTGAVIWRLGGKKSDFTLGPGLPFAWQHNAIAVDASTIRIFDNESNGIAVLPASRVIWVKHDDTAMTASIVESIQHPAGLSVLAEGSAEALSNGDTFVGWGILGRFSEFDSNGALVFDASLLPGYNCYRAYRFPWVATPSTSPTARAQYNSDGTMTVHAIWNGATEVSSWEVMGGNSSDNLRPLATVSWNGLDTAITVPTQAIYIKVVAINSTGVSIGSSDPLPTPLSFVVQPSSQTISNGSTVVFDVAATGPLPTYQWTFNGSPLADGTSGGTTFSGTTGPKLVINGATAANAGNYVCVATDSGSSGTSASAALAVSTTQDVGRLINVSALAHVGTGDNVLIAGFVVGGQQVLGTQDLLIRASGPALVPLGISGALPDPELVLSRIGTDMPRQKTVPGWGGSSLISDTAASVGAFAWTDPASLDAATVHKFHQGLHTVEILGSSGDTGTALAEVYDATSQGTYMPSMPHLTNVSARAQVGTGGNVLTAGFVIGGTTSKTVLIRASGPALVPFGISDALPDPLVQLYSTSSGGVLLAVNSSWKGDPEIAAAAASAGAFPWQNASTADSALLVTLPPGSYTAQVLGQSGDTGVALVEVYEIQ